MRPEVHWFGTVYPEPENTFLRVDGLALESEGVAIEPDDPALRCDMTTRYAWGKPGEHWICDDRVIDVNGVRASSRQWAWDTWEGKPVLHSWTPDEPLPRALSLSQTKPWEDHGISRRTWERRRRRQRNPNKPRPRAPSLSQTKPWEAEGISRRTWERRRRDATRDAN
jgi:hypothetical protein